METRVSSPGREVIIGDDQPTVLIGERINPTGKKKLAEALKAGDLEIVRRRSAGPSTSRGRHSGCQRGNIRRRRGGSTPSGSAGSDGRSGCASMH